MQRYVVFLADALFGPFEGNLMIAGKGLHPPVVIGGALAQDFLADGADAMHLAEEVHDVFRAREQRHMAQDAMRSKHWYTKASRLPNKRTKSSIGPLALLRFVSQQEHRTGDRWRSKKFQIFLLRC